HAPKIIAACAYFEVFELRFEGVPYFILVVEFLHHIAVADAIRVICYGHMTVTGVLSSTHDIASADRCGKDERTSRPQGTRDLSQIVAESHAWIDIIAGVAGQNY